MRSKRLIGLSSAAVAMSLAVGSADLVAQRGGAAGVSAYIKVNAPVVAITHARVIDGTGAPARADETLVIRNGVIAALGPTSSTPAPEGATVIDGTGKSLIPGLVMMHEHLFYPVGPGVYGQVGVSFARLYLAGGVTTMRTAGNTNGVMDINLAEHIRAGTAVGPEIDATAPYLEGPNTQLQMHALKDADDARRQVDYWSDMGATSFKAYMNITRAELGAAIQEAHHRGFKLTGHLCSVTLSEAADLGIDDIEHAFMASTDFVPDKQPDKCPGQSVGQRALAAVDPDGVPFRTLVKKLIDHHVALTSTLTVFETFTPGRPSPPGLDVLLPELAEQFAATHTRIQETRNSIYSALLPKGMALEHAFAQAGGLLLAGTDPTGSGGVVPGFSDHRQLELLVEAGFTPLQALSICTLNGAKYLGRETKIGTLAVGKQADLVIVSGDPSTNIADVENVDTVFKAGVGFDPAKLIASVKGKVGLW